MDRLRSRLILAFLLAALLPAVPLSLVVRDLLRRSFEPGWGAVIQTGLTAGMAESRERLREARLDLQTEAEALVRTPGIRPTPGNGPAILQRVAPGDSGGVAIPEPLEQWAARAVPGTPERVEEWLATIVTAPDGAPWLYARPLPEGMREHAASLSESLGLLEALRQTRRAVLQSYVAPFLVAYLALLGLVAGLALILARQIARPLEALSEATRRVAAGQFDTRVIPRGSGEVRRLEDSMNRMIEQLQLQKTEMARLERQAAWRDLARRLAHEIKNPLTPIQLAVQELGQRYSGDDPRFRSLLDTSVEIVSEEVAALRRLVQEFSDFARLPQPVPVVQPVAPLLEELARLYGPERVVVTAPPAGLSAAIDPVEMRRALINLIDNGHHACRAAGRPERVELGAFSTGDEVTIQVRDDGCGIPPESLERIFEPSFTTRADGMGLGLPIVDGIVRGHGGRVRVSSTPGHGTTFSLEIPARRREERTT